MAITTDSIKKVTDSAGIIKNLVEIINDIASQINRKDIIRVGVCHSKAGLDGVKDGKIHAITFQSAEGGWSSCR